MINFNKPIRSTLSYLKEKYPTEGWKAKRVRFGWSYYNDKDDNAWWCSSLAPRYDGDDDSFVSQFHIYRKNGIIERVWFY